jgi:hypothetical protein
MSPGAKVFLTLAGIGGIFGVLALAASKKSHAASLPPGGTVVVPPHDGARPSRDVPGEPEGGFSRDNPFAVPGIQDARRGEPQLLLALVGNEGQSLVASDTAPDRPSVPLISAAPPPI